MSSKNADAPQQRRSWSIARRLTVLYCLSAFVLLSLASGYLYWGLKNNLAEEDHELLGDMVNVIRFIMRDRPDDLSALREEVEWESAARRFSKYYTRILDASNQVIMVTTGMEALVPASEFPAPLPEPEPLRQSLEWDSPGGRTFLLASAIGQLGTNAPQLRVIQIALDVTPEAGILADYRAKLGMVLLLGLAASAAAGVWIARQGLRPLEEITRATQLVTASQLNERIGESPWPAELSVLAMEFDRMLGRLQDSFTRLSQFSADLAHELRNPINNLMGEAEVALSRSRSPDEYRGVLESNLEELHHLARMIDSLLFIARADHAQTRLELKPLEARGEIQAVLDFHEAEAAEHEVQLSGHGDATIHADPTLLRRALSNLISNALAHTPAGGHIRVSAEKGSGDSVNLSVADDGKGIPPEHLPRVFDRFYRVDPARSRHTTGTGLGLAIVRSIAELHDGAASIESQPTKGTVVTMRFPAARKGGK